MKSCSMSTQQGFLDVDIVEALCELRSLLSAAHGTFADDRVIAQPLGPKHSSRMIYCAPATAAERCLALRLLSEAHQKAIELISAELGSRGELRAIAVEIKSTIEHVLWILGVEPFEEGERLSAAYYTNHAWTLAAVALRLGALK
jgi:hypothetical protein